MHVFVCDFNDSAMTAEQFAGGMRVHVEENV